MRKEDYLSVIEELVYQVTGISELTPDTDFIRDLALNSLDVANLVCAFEDRFQVEIPVRDVWKLSQVRDVIEKGNACAGTVKNRCKIFGIMVNC